MAHAFTYLLLVHQCVSAKTSLAVCAEPDDGFRGEPEPAPESWSGDSLMARAAQCLKKNKADKLNDDEVDDYDWTCQGCLVRK